MLALAVDNRMQERTTGSQMSSTVLRSVVTTVRQPRALLSERKGVSPEFHFSAGPTQFWESEVEHQVFMTLSKKKKENSRWCVRKFIQASARARAREREREREHACL